MSGPAAEPPADSAGAPSERNRFARLLFADLPSGYDRLAEVLSFGQNGRWRRFMVSRVEVSGGARVLDVATGTAAVATAVAGRTGATVVGLDQSEEMLRIGARRLRGRRLEQRVHLVLGRGERLPFPDDTFDAVTFTYLLRYVDDPATTLAELARVLRAGGTLANLEFHVPSRGPWLLVWSAYTRFVLPVLGRAASPAWEEVGRFLGPSIRDFYRRHPLTDQLAMWRGAGIGDVRARAMSLGSGVVVWGRKIQDVNAGADGERPAFYALAPGGWRDWWTLLHPPYTTWHLSYVAFGAATATVFSGYRLGLAEAGFFLGVGITAHALDELRGRPLDTQIGDAVLWTAALAALAGAVALGFYGAWLVSWWLVPFIVAGVFIVLAYNLELFGGAFHSDLWFALAWGGFPALTGAFAQQGTVRWPAVLVAAACAALSAAQRTLSTPVRWLRRSVAGVEGRVLLRGGGEVPLDAAALRAAPERALRLLSAGLPLLAAGLVFARLVH